MTAETVNKSRYMLIIIAISLAVLMSSLDATIVNVTIPTISEAFNITSSMASWVSTTYMLVMAGTLMLFGKLADRAGYKKIFIGGFITFTIGSFLCGFLPEFTGIYATLPVSRIIQGLGGAVMITLSTAMVGVIIPNEIKGKAMGIAVTMGSLGMAIGPALGGFITEYLSWNWVFFINIPVGIAAVIFSHIVIPKDSPCNDNLGKFDRLGAVSIFVFLASLLFFVSEGPELGWTSPSVLAALILSAAFAVILVITELKKEDPLFDIRLFKNRGFLCAGAAVMLIMFIFSGINYVMPFYLGYVKGLSVSFTGLTLSVTPLAIMLSGVIGGFIAGRDNHRKIITCGALIYAAGIFLLVFLGAGTKIEYVAICLFLIGMGLGLSITTLLNIIVSSVPKSSGGMISGLTSVERFAPMSIGIAVFNMVFSFNFAHLVEKYNVEIFAPADIPVDILSASFDRTFIFAAAAAIVLIIISLGINLKIHPDHMTDSKN